MKREFHQVGGQAGTQPQGKHHAQAGRPPVRPPVQLDPSTLNQKESQPKLVTQPGALPQGYMYSQQLVIDHAQAAQQNLGVQYGAQMPRGGSLNESSYVRPRYFVRPSPPMLNQFSPPHFPVAAQYVLHDRNGNVQQTTQLFAPNNRGPMPTLPYLYQGGQEQRQEINQGTNHSHPITQNPIANRQSESAIPIIEPAGSATFTARAESPNDGMLIQTRKNIYALILHLLEQQINPVGMNQDALKLLSWSIEKHLYQTAYTYEEYSNVLTIKDRVVKVAMDAAKLKRRHRKSVK